MFSKPSLLSLLLSFGGVTAIVCKRKTTDKIVVKIIAVIWQMTAMVTAIRVWSGIRRKLAKPVKDRWGMLANRLGAVETCMDP